MTVTTTTRFGVSRWSSDSDSLTRTQIDEAHANIEFYMAKIISGTSVPTLGLTTYAKTLFLNQSNNRIYYYTTEDSSGQWVYIETDVISSTLANAKGDLIVSSGPNAWTTLPAGLENQILAVVDNSKSVSWSTVLEQKGDLLTIESGSLSRFPRGQDNHVLHVNSTLPGGLGYSLLFGDYFENASVSTSKIDNQSIVANKIINSAIVSSKIIPSSVSETKIADLAVSSNSIAASAVTESKLSDNSITEQKVANLSISAESLQNSAVAQNKIFGEAITTSKIFTFSVSESKLASNSISSTKISSNAVDTNALASNSVTSIKILDKSVAAENINNLAAITEKIVSNAVTQTKIAAGSVGANQLATGSAVSEKFGDLQVTQSKLNALAVTSNKIGDNSVASSKIGDLSIVSSKYLANAVTNSRLRPSAATSIIGNALNALGNVADIVAANDNTILRREGNFLSFGSAQTQNFADLSVTSSSVLDESISDVQVSSSANIALTKLGSGALPVGIKVGTGNYTNNSVTLSKLNSSRTSDGIGVWFDYTPSVWKRKDGVETLYPSANLNIRHAKYMKINGLCLVNVQLNLLQGTERSRQFILSLPLAPLSPSLQPVGTCVFINVDSPGNMSYVQPIIYQGRIGLSRGAGWPYFGFNNEPLTIGTEGDLLENIDYAENFDFISFSIAYEVAT